MVMSGRSARTASPVCGLSPPASGYRRPSCGRRRIAWRTLPHPVLTRQLADPVAAPAEIKGGRPRGPFGRPGGPAGRDWRGGKERKGDEAFVGPLVTLVCLMPLHCDGGRPCQNCSDAQARRLRPVSRPATDNSQKDFHPFVFDDMKKQRQLSDQGRKVARQIGGAMTIAGHFNRANLYRASSTGRSKRAPF